MKQELPNEYCQFCGAWCGYSSSGICSMCKQQIGTNIICTCVSGNTGKKCEDCKENKQ